jgi:hypothetical protein
MTRVRAKGSSLQHSKKLCLLPMGSLTHDIEIAKAELTDIISEKDDSKKNGNAGGVRGDLPIPRGLQQKKIADSVARKRKTKQHNSDDEDMYDSDHPREEMHKGVKIGEGAIIPKREEGNLKRRHPRVY